MSSETTPQIEPTAQIEPAAQIEPSSLGLRTVHLRPHAGLRRALAPSELWPYRELALQLAVRDVTVRYRQTLLGAAWAVLQPVGTMVVFTIFFGHLAHLKSEGHAYALFSLAGLVPWTFFANALLLGSQSLLTNKALVSKTYFPRIFIPAGLIAAGLVDLAIGFVILIVVVLASGSSLGVGLLLVPLLVLITAVAALGVASALAAVNVRYRDVQYVVPFAVQLWLFATPIAYPLTLVHGAWHTLLAINPMTGVVEGFRWAVLGGGSAPWDLIAISAASAIVLLAAGLAYFARAERSFADIV
jgi:lipopolysaccharide transport system permease protein